MDTIPEQTRDSLRELRLDFKAHIADDNRMMGEILKVLARIEVKLDPDSQHYILKEMNGKIDPIVETYTSVNRFGKWLMTILISLSLLVGVIWGIIQIIISHKP